MSELPNIRHLSTGSGCDTCKAENGGGGSRAYHACNDCSRYLCYNHAIVHQCIGDKK